ncbi:hypothetical protein PFISCL1PPCAC_23530, partial [Pristionchus fissidentatus]
EMDAVTPSIATSSDIPDMHEFMLADFLPSLSIAAALGITREETDLRYLRLTTNCVNSGTSVVLRNSSGRVVGLRLCDVEERGHAHSIEGLDQLSEKLKKIYRLVDVLNEDKWSSIPSSVDRLWLVEVVAVDREYRGRGLSRLLMEFGLEEATRRGISAAAAEVVANASIALFAKYGYSLLKEVVHSEYLGADGLPVFKCPGGEKVAQLVFKML